MHIRLKGHKWTKKRVHLTERRDVKRDMMEAMQQLLPKVKWGDAEIDNCWLFEYLGSLFQADGDQTADVQRRCGMAKSRAGTLRHVWATTLPIDLKVRLYIASCCSMLVYGSEAWTLDEKTKRCINGSNAYMLSHITGKTKHEETTKDKTTFNILAWIRARRLKWVGHILRLDNKRLIKQALKVIYDNRQEGDILMDVPQELNWQQLQEMAEDKNGWRARVHTLKEAARRTTAPPQKDKQRCNNNNNTYERDNSVPLLTAKTCSKRKKEKENKK